MPRLLLLLSLLVVSPALALQQPNGAQIPSMMGCDGGKPTGLAATFACVCGAPGICNIGAPCSSMTNCPDGKNGICETTLWHNFNDNTCIPSNRSGLDPWTEASTLPETFQPTCPLTFTVVSRSDARFKNAFGWYNVTGKKPAPADLHLMLDCQAAAGAQVVLDVKNDPAYLGGEVGFFLVTPESHAQKTQCAGGNCCAATARLAAGEGYVYYSQRAYNDDNNGPAAFIHLVIYDSHLTQKKFYFAWEDLFGGSNNTFTDLVTSVQGVECSGGGTVCNTGSRGVCANGVNQCESGKLSCIPIYAPRPEVCDGLDQDCDGVVDNGAVCPNGDICHNGQCVPHCAQSSEFSCGSDMICDPTTGLCGEPGCGSVSCPADQVCRGGHCVGACDGIICPHGTECRLGSCVNPCKYVTCETGKQCAGGLCVPSCNQCGGLTCKAPETCQQSTGACGDPSCPVGCPAGTFCDHGTCKDSCAGAMCPPGQACKGGECVPGIGPGSVDPSEPDGGSGQSGEAGCGACDRSRDNGRGSSMLFVLLFGAGGLARRRRGR